MEYGIWSVVPPFVALVLAFLTKEVFTSLLLGILLGYMVLSNGNLLEGLYSFLEGMVKVFQDSGNTRTIMFCILVGGLIKLIQVSGGVTGFISWFQSKLGQSKNNKKKVELYAFLVGTLIFIETSISVLTVGTIFRSIFDKFKISREKLAYIADSCSAPVCILIPFNAWGAYILTLLSDQDVDQPVGLFVQSIAFNFYPIFALILLIFSIVKGFELSPLKSFEPRKFEEQHKDDFQEGQAMNMVIPILIMILMTPTILAATGWGTSDPTESWFSRLGTALVSGSGSFAVLSAVSLAVFTSICMILLQRRHKLNDVVGFTLEGMKDLLPLGIIMLLAFAINILCRELETGIYIASVVNDTIPGYIIPPLIFIISSIIAFSTGTSWGTFAIMIGISLPIAQQMDLNTALILGAVLGGGIFGDHCSPISDTTIIASTAADCDHIDHVRTQLPYALSAGAVSVLFYLLCGIFL